MIHLELSDIRALLTEHGHLIGQQITLSSGCCWKYTLTNRATNMVIYSTVWFENEDAALKAAYWGLNQDLWKSCCKFANFGRS